MSRINGKETKPEVVVRKYLFSEGFRYRKNVKDLPGTPDIVLPRYKTVIFVNGCFWHGHKGCRHFVVPDTNREFWIGKIEANIQRDARKSAELEKLGWRVIVIWECELNTKVRDMTLLRLKENIINQNKGDNKC